MRLSKFHIDSSFDCLAHGQVCFQREFFTLPNLRIMTRCLNHQQKIDVLIYRSIIFKVVNAHQSQRQISKNSLDLLGLLGKVVNIHDYSHHIVDFEV